jgi:hypothetical protein
MTNIEIYNDLVSKTEGFKISKQKAIFNISELCFLLGSLQISEETLHQVDFENHREDFAKLFEDYYPRALLKNGQYLAQLNHVLDFFKPENPSPYKKVTQAFFLTARYFAHYDSFEAFRKEVYLTCVDEESTLKYLMDFRKTSGLSLAYFVKTCTFFEKAGFFDIPLVTKKAKAYLLPLFEIPDENELLYKKMKALAKANHITCHELNERIQALNA